MNRRALCIALPLPLCLPAAAVSAQNAPHALPAVEDGARVFTPLDLGGSELRESVSLDIDSDGRVDLAQIEDDELVLIRSVDTRTDQVLRLPLGGRPSVCLDPTDPTRLLVAQATQLLRVTWDAASGNPLIQETGVPGWGGASQLCATDVDGDDRLDLAGLDDDGASLLVSYCVGGVLQEAVALAVPENLEALRPMETATGDALAAHSTASVYVYQSSTWTSQRPPDGKSVVGVAPFRNVHLDHDSIAVLLQTDIDNQWLEVIDSEVNEPGSVFLGASRLSGLVAGDLNGNGCGDLAATSRLNPWLYILANLNHESAPTGAPSFALAPGGVFVVEYTDWGNDLSTQWARCHIADLDLDGDPEISVAVASDSTLFIQRGLLESENRHKLYSDDISWNAVGDDCLLKVVPQWYDGGDPNTPLDMSWLQGATHIEVALLSPAPDCTVLEEQTLAAAAGDLPGQLQFLLTEVQNPSSHYLSLRPVTLLQDTRTWAGPETLMPVAPNNGGPLSNNGGITPGHTPRPPLPPPIPPSGGD